CGNGARRARRPIPERNPEGGHLARSAPDGLSEELVGLSEALDEEAGDSLVESVLAGVGGGAQGGGADLDHRHLAVGGDGGGAAAAAPGEVDHLAEAAAGLDLGELVVFQGDGDLALDEEVEGFALVALADDDGARCDAAPGGDAHDFPERDVA